MRRIRSTSPRPRLAAWLPALLVALAATPAAAVRVQQVRVGDHAEFTRIVLELDGPAPYTLSQRPTAAGGELLVEIEAQSGTRVVGSRSRLVESVSLRPEAAGSVARVQLRSANVIVKEMVLKGPHRIVLDVAAAPKAATAPAPKAPTSTLAELPPPAPAPTKVASAPTAAKPPAPTATRPPAPTAVKPPPEVAQAPKLPQPEVQAVPERRVVERAAAPRPGESAAPAPGASGPAPATGLAASEPAASPESPTEPALESGPGPRPRPDAEATARAARKPAEPPAPEPSPSFAERLGAGDPTAGLSFALGGVLILLLAFVALRRRSARIAREAAATPWPPPGAQERPEFATAHEESAEDAWEQRGDAGPLFAATEAEPAGDDAAPAAALPDVPFHVEPEVVAKEADASRVEELERRLERLEARLADNLDARDRLERQLAAHTEELRVQRAAIARTQRAVRAAVRGPEGAGQPGGDPQGAGPQPGEG